MDMRDAEPAGSIGNGVSTPLFAEGLVLQAADLSLGQAARDAELARMRTLLHGWGVVAGLIPEIIDKALVISPGYGVLPAGGELFLASPLTITLPSTEELAGLCGSITGCELPTDHTPTPAAGPLPVWLAVGAGGQPAAPRGVVLAGCEHPANAAEPTRWCHQVQLHLLCELPESHRLPEPSCQELAPYVCADPPLPVPLPDPPPGHADLLVLGRLLPQPETVDLDLAGRHRLLPHYLLQDWLRSCLCPVLADPDPVPEPEPDPDPRPPKELSWKDLQVLMRKLGMDRLPKETRPTTVFNMYKPERLTRISVVDRLEKADISGPADFQQTNPRRLLLITGMSKVQLAAAARELTWIATQITF